MNQQPDKLFRDKLEGFSKPVPSRAWDKIETNLDKKNNSGLWLKIAASLLLLAAATFILWPGYKTVNHDQQLANKPVDELMQKTTPEKNITSVTPNEQSTVEEKEQKSNTKRVQHSPRVVHTPDPTDKASVMIADHTTPVIEEPVDNAVEASPEMVVVPETLVAQEIISEPATQNITLVFNADDTDEYLDKKSLAKATAEQEDASTFKKLLKKVKGLKNNQDPFGELRQKKNEILALNFKNEKRGQNK